MWRTILDNQTKECTGKCCRAFVLGGYSVEYIQTLYDAVMRSEIGQYWFDWQPAELSFYNQHKLIYQIEDIIFWWPWMVYIGTFEKHPITGKKTPKMDYFSCIQHSHDGKCLVYDQRPHFCRSYGVTVECEHDDCFCGVKCEEYNCEKVAKC